MHKDLHVKALIKLGSSGKVQVSITCGFFYLTLCENVPAALKNVPSPVYESV